MEATDGEDPVHGPVQNVGDAAALLLNLHTCSLLFMAKYQ